MKGHNMRSTQLHKAAGIISLLAGTAMAQDFSISSYSIAGGAAVLEGGSIILTGNTGQPVTGPMMGGGFSLTAGFTQGSTNPPACPADLTGDGILNFFDVSAFLAAYSAGLPDADFTGDGVFNFFDVSAFLAAYSSGCP